MLNTLLFIPHGHCYLWKPNLVGLHLVSDALTGIAYYSIPCTLFYFVQKRKDVPFISVFLLFVAFIVFCGTTHLMSVWTLWHPAYWLSGGIKAMTAGISVYTAFRLIPVVPKALDLPSPAQLERINRQLQQEIAERKQAEEHLQELSARLNLAVESAALGIWEWDITQNNLIWDERMYELYGVKPEQFTHSYEAWVGRLHPEDRMATTTAIQQALRGEKAFDAECRLMHPDGSIRYVQANALVQRNFRGEPQRMVGIHYDISDRKQAEASLRESEQRYATLAAAAPVGIFRTDAERLCTYVNDRWRQIAGLTAEAAVGEGWRQGLHPEDRDRLAAEWDQSAHENRPFQLEYRFQRPEGALTWVYGRAVAERDADGRVIGYVGTVTDVSDLKQAEAQLQNLIAGTAATTGQNFFPALVRHIAAALNVSYALVTEQVDDELRTLAFWANGALQSPLSYHPAKTPCELTLRDGKFYCEHSVQQRFPKDLDLVEMRAESYLGIALRDAQDKEIGDLCILNQQPIKDPQRAENLLRVFAARASAELERQRANASLEQLNQALEAKVKERTQELWQVNNLQRAILNGADYSIISTDPTGLIQIFNAAAERMLGYFAAEVSGKVTPELFHDRQEIIDRAASLSAELGKDVPPDYEVFVAKARQGSVSENEWTYIRKDGSRFPVFLSVTPLKDNQEELTGFLGIAKDITQQKQAEERLRKSEAHLKAAQRIGKLGSWEYDLQTGEIQWSEEVFRMFGRELAAGSPNFEEIPQLLHPEDREPYQQTVEIAIKTVQPYEIELRSYRADGSLVYVQVRGEPILDAAGQITQLVGTVLDITDRKQAEAAIQESEARFRHLADQAPVFMWMSGQDKICFHFNKRWLEFTGRTIEQEVGNGWTEGVHPDDLQFCLDTYITAFDAHLSFEMEYRLRRFDGAYRWILDVGIPRYDANGEFLGYIGSAIDISDRKHAEEQLRNLSDRLKLAVTSGAIGIWDWNVVQNILTWDDQMYELYGITSDEFQGVYDAWLSRLHPDDRPMAETAIQQALAGEKEYDLEFRVVHPDGSIHFIKANALVQRTDRGEPQRMVGINFDITDRKQAETTIQQTAAQLKASNRELEAFAYSVSHDLRAPLRAINGFSKALLEDYGGIFDEEAQDYFGRICSNVNRMSLLIDDLLNLSRVSRSDIRCTMVNLSTLAQELINELQTSEPMRSVEWIIAPEAIVCADATLMRVVLTNLLDNAWKFTRHHPVARIEFGLICSDEQPTFFVRDNGAGFDMRYAKMLFGVFQRLHSIHEFPGTGIGLAAVQRAIHRHGGCVWAESAVEQGATFYFTLPNSVAI